MPGRGILGALFFVPRSCSLLCASELLSSLCLGVALFALGLTVYSHLGDFVGIEWDFHDDGNKSAVAMLCFSCSPSCMHVLLLDRQKASILEK
jgi:hypothetical protein